MPYLTDVYHDQNRRHGVEPPAQHSRYDRRLADAAVPCSTSWSPPGGRMNG